jgi:chaperonin GroEL
MKDRKERVIDAVEATKSAVEEGIVAGGGITFLKIQADLTGTFEHLPSDDQRLGAQIALDSLIKPIEMLFTNAGIQQDISQLPLDGKTGVNVETEATVNMFEAGIIDPAKVLRSAAENAISIASMVLTTEALVTEIPEDKKSPTDSQ